jgi:hypothetical protein
MKMQKWLEPSLLEEEMVTTFLSDNESDRFHDIHCHLERLLPFLPPTVKVQAIFAFSF